MTNDNDSDFLENLLEMSISTNAQSARLAAALLVKTQEQTAEITRLKIDYEKARDILVDVCNATGSAACTQGVSLEFLSFLPDEVRLYTNGLRQNLQRLESKAAILESRLYEALGMTETYFNDCPHCARETLWQAYEDGDESGCEGGAFCLTCEYNPQHDDVPAEPTP